MINQGDLLQDRDEAGARRHELIRHLGERGGFDPALRELAWRKLGAAALTDEALQCLHDLLGVLARGEGDDGHR